MTDGFLKGAIVLLTFANAAAAAQVCSCRVLGLGIVKISRSQAIPTWQVYLENRTGREVKVKVNRAGFRWRLEELASGEWKQLGEWGVGPGVDEITAAPQPSSRVVETILGRRRTALEKFDLRLIPDDYLRPGGRYRFSIVQELEMFGTPGPTKCRLISEPHPFRYKFLSGNRDHESR